MEIDELLIVLATASPEPADVEQRLREKLRRRTRRRVLAAAAVITVTVGGLGTAAALTDRPSGSHPQALAGPTLSAAPSPDPGQYVAVGCAASSLSDTLAQAHAAGASVIEGTGRLTGVVKPTGLPWVQMRLDAVRTLSGPHVAPGHMVWINSGLYPAGPDPVAEGALWGPDGSLFGIVWPNGNLRVAPLVRREIVFSRAGCWDIDGLTRHPFNGPLGQAPGSNSQATAEQQGGLWAVPAAAVEKLAR